MAIGAGHLRVHLRYHETFLLLEGSVSIDVEGGETVDLEEGDMVSFSAGTKAVWHVHRASKKFFVVSG